MLKLVQIDTENHPPDARATLSFDQRQKARNRIQLDDGREAGIFLPRGHALKHGEVLISEDGVHVEIHAAIEAVSVVTSDDMLLLQRACYHLGNRHVPLQISLGTVSYQTDHVLDDMVTQLGLNVIHQNAPFEPEPGAYHKHHHG